MRVLSINGGEKQGWYLSIYYTGTDILDVGCRREAKLFLATTEHLHGACVDEYERRYTAMQSKLTDSVGIEMQRSILEKLQKRKQDNDDPE